MQISAPLVEQRKRVCMTVDGVSAYAVVFGDPDRAGPRHKRLLDFFALGMGADFAVVLVSTLADRGGSCLARQLSSSWFTVSHETPYRCGADHRALTLC